MNLNDRPLIPNIVDIILVGLNNTHIVVFGQVVYHLLVRVCAAICRLHELHKLIFEFVKNRWL